MTTNSGSGASGAPLMPSPAGLTRTADEISLRINELRKTQAAMRWQMTAATLAILVLMLIFAFVTYNTVRRNLSGARMQEALSEKMNQMGPDLTPKFAAAVREAEPVYRELAMERLKKVAPQVQEKFRTRAAAAPAQLREELRSAVLASVQNVEAKLRGDLHHQYPKLSEDQLRGLADQIHAGLTVEAEKLAQRLNGLMASELGKLRGILEEFPRPDVGQGSPDELQKLLVHNLIMMADHELLVRGTDEELTNRVIGILPELGRESIGESGRGMGEGSALGGSAESFTEGADRVVPPANAVEHEQVEPGETASGEKVERRYRERLPATRPAGGGGAATRPATRSSSSRPATR